VKKYKLLKNDTISLYGTPLYRIQALRSFGSVKKGELGGYIESKENLSHSGECWVFGNAKVCENARVSENAEVYGNAWVKQHDAVISPKDLFNITGFTHNITVTRCGIHIGCKDYTFDQLDHIHTELLKHEVNCIKKMIEICIESFIENS
jgi:hypothetical protein